jgi:hypothetical protein
MSKSWKQHSAEEKLEAMKLLENIYKKHGSPKWF